MGRVLCEVVINGTLIPIIDTVACVLLQGFCCSNAAAAAGQMTDKLAKCFLRTTGRPLWQIAILTNRDSIHIQSPESSSAPAPSTHDKLRINVATMHSSRARDKHRVIKVEIRARSVWQRDHGDAEREEENTVIRQKAYD